MPFSIHLTYKFPQDKVEEILVLEGEFLAFKERVAFAVCLNEMVNLRNEPS